MTGRTTGLLVAAVLAAGGLVAVGATTVPASAASSKDLTFQHSGKVMKNEIFQVSGRLSTHETRSVKLQVRKHKSSGSWSTYDTTVSSDGYFEFTPQIPASRYLRYYAPAGEGRKAITGNARKATVVPQEVTYFGVTPDFQCTNVDHRDVTMFVKFSPARSGRVVAFLTNVGIEAVKTDGRGIASLTFAPGTSAFQFDAVAAAQPYQDAGRKTSSKVKYVQQACAE